LGNRLAESNARLGTRTHQFKRSLGDTDQPHAVMNAARPEPSLRDLEPAPLTEQQIFLWNADIDERDLRMAIRRIVVTKNAELPLYNDSIGIHWYKYHRLLQMP